MGERTAGEMIPQAAPPKIKRSRCEEASVMLHVVTTPRGTRRDALSHGEESQTRHEHDRQEVERDGKPP
jgi:hypothetical protein